MKLEGFFAHEDLDHRGVELSAGLLLKYIYCAICGKREPIGSIGGHRVIGIDNTQDSSADWNFIPLKAIGISLAVPTLVMPSNYRNNLGEITDFADNPLADEWVGFDNFTLIGSE